MGRSNEHPGRIQERRRRLAHELARLMNEGGADDFRQAKLRAARRLGIHDEAAMPRNQDIEAALREYQRLFSGPEQRAALHRLRRAALDAMTFFSGFSPRLAGPVLEGTAGTDAAVELHLHSDAAEDVAHFLQDQRIPAQSRDRRVQFDASRVQSVPGWTFSAGEVPFELLVLPLEALRHPPLSPIDGKPMARASAAQLQRLLRDDDGPADS